MEKEKIQTFLVEEEREEEIKKDPWTLLLKEVKVTKDSLDKKDIWLNEVEVEIIDSQDFQRLREISQIPFAEFAYMGATHTRFEHSIGTLHLVQTMASNINKNADRWEGCERLSSRDIFIARLVGLLHDLAHLTYPHILEDGAIFKEKQWADEERIEKFLGENTEIYSIIRRNIKEAFEKCKEPDWKKAFAEAIEDIKESLRNIEKGIEETKREIVFADIVGNTICADILDYIPRDMFHTGLEGRYDDRILSYFVVKKVDGKRRVAIRLFKDNKYRDSILSSCMQILELRYELASKVYYHHTRRKARAMATEMVGAGIKAGFLDKKRLLEMGRIALREYILGLKEKKTVEEPKKKYLTIAKKLAKDLKNRKLYDVLYETGTVELRSKELIGELEEDWEKRFETEREMEALFGLEPGNLIIFVPSKSMDAKKTLETLVEVPFTWRPTVKTLDRLETRDFPDEYRDIYEVINMTKNMIIRKHELLWKLTVYVHKDVDIQIQKKIKVLCEQWFKGAAPVTLIEALAERKKTSLTPTRYTQIAEEVNETLVATFPSTKSLFATAVDTARSLLESGK
ncbi:MAG: HD domain-containing protein [Candidatus Hodarchaeota archaeon]